MRQIDALSCGMSRGRTDGSRGAAVGRVSRADRQAALLQHSALGQLHYAFVDWLPAASPCGAADAMDRQDQLEDRGIKAEMFEVMAGRRRRIA
jgi:hypothetical protein